MRDTDSIAARKDAGNVGFLCLAGIDLRAYRGFQRWRIPGHAGFLIQRASNGATQLITLRKHLVKFRSDYHHVFYCLRQVQANESQMLMRI